MGSLEQHVPAHTHNIPRFPKLSWMKFSGHFLELDSFSFFFFFHLSLSLSRSPLLLFRSLLPSPFPTSLWLLTHAAVGCRGGHFMSLLLSLSPSLSLSLSPSPSLTTSFSLPRSLLLSHSSCLKLGFNFLSTLRAGRKGRLKEEKH